MGGGGGGGGLGFAIRLVMRCFGFRLWLLTKGWYYSDKVYKGGKKRHPAAASWVSRAD